MPREHGKTGDFVETVTLDDVYAVFDDVHPPFVTSSDVSDAVGCNRDTARRKLKELHREGRVDRRKSAGRIIWWRTEDFAAEEVNDDE
jgi:CTP-dependent riboflavin kinase